jgi:hypothetical protein
MSETRLPRLAVLIDADNASAKIVRHYGANATKHLAVSLASKLTMENGGDGLIA